MKTKKNTKAKPEPPREVPQRLFPMVEGKPKPSAPCSRKCLHRHTIKL